MRKKEKKMRRVRKDGRADRMYETKYVGRGGTRDKRDKRETGVVTVWRESTR